jgi:NTP pyrophosphatase (non-canonical NTP hydrolase)
MTFLEITILIHDERERQLAKWGEQHHSHLEWLGILVEEVGEAAEAIVKRYIDHESLKDDPIIKEVIQLTAVGMAWLEDKIP